MPTILSATVQKTVSAATVAMVVNEQKCDLNTAKL